VSLSWVLLGARIPSCVAGFHDLKKETITTAAAAATAVIVSY